jgi:hypothetical protein
MSLQLPTPLVEVSPFAGAVDINAAFTTVDSHDHSPGKGSLVPTAGLNINADLSFIGNNATNLRSAKFQNQTSSLSGVSDVGCIYMSGGDLYFNSGAGQPVHMTSGAALNLSSAGSISGLSGTTAALTYSSANQTFYFTQNSGISALISSSALTLSAPTSGAFGITLQSPLALALAYTITLPPAAPTVTSPIQMDSSGNLSFITPVPIQVSASSGTFATTSTSFVSVTNLSVSITSIGKPVMISIVPDGTASAGAGGYLETNAGDIMNLIIQRNGTTIYSTNVGGQAQMVVPAMITFPDRVGAGTYTYTVQVRSQAGNFVSVYYCMLTAYGL